MPSETAETSRKRTAVAAALVAIVYFVAGKLGLRLAIVHEAATAVWAPAGIALAGYLLFGRAIWPALFASAFLVNATTLPSWPAALGIAAGNTLEGLIAARLLDSSGGRRVFHSPAGVLRFAGLAGLVATLVAAVIGPLALWLAGLAEAARLPGIAATWWLGDAMGVLLFTPLIVLWPVKPEIRVSWIEAVAFLAVLVPVCGIIYGGWLSSTPPIGFLTLPLLMWAAFRFGLPGTSKTAVLLGAIAVWNALQGRGPYVGHDRNQTFLILQSFMGVTSTTCLAVAAAVEERRARLREVLELNASLDARKAELSAYHRLLSHDVSNVAMSALALLERLLFQADGPLTPKQEELARRAYRQALEMNRMTENARLLLRLRESGRDAPAEAFEVQPLLRKTLETVRMMHFDRPFDVETKGTERLVWKGSPFLESVLMNLIDNAVRHTKRGQRPSIQVRAEEKEGTLRLAVRGGQAAEPERLREILDPAMAGRTSSGHGLGLMLVKEIVERDGGQVRMGTSRDEAGERFEVELLLPRR